MWFIIPSFSCHFYVFTQVHCNFDLISSSFSCRATTLGVLLVCFRQFSWSPITNTGSNCWHQSLLVLQGHCGRTSSKSLLLWSLDISLWRQFLQKFELLGFSLLLSNLPNFTLIFQPLVFRYLSRSSSLGLPGDFWSPLSRTHKLNVDTSTFWSFFSLLVLSL